MQNGDPLEIAVKEKLNLNWDGLIEKCNKNEKNASLQLSKIQQSLGSLQGEIMQKILENSNYIKSISDDYWRESINEYCMMNKKMKSMCANAVDLLRKCTLKNRIITVSDLHKKECDALKIL